jgi:predicted phage baseplate assembly protein
MPDSDYTMLTITIDTAPDSTDIEPGYRISFPYDSSKVTISFENEDEFFVLDESLMPPTALDVVALDAEYNQITPGSWVAIKRPGEAAAVFQVLSADTVSLAAYGISGKVTQLTLNDDWLTTADILLSALRQTTIYAQSEKLALAEEPINDDVAGDSIELDALYDGLEAGRWVIVSGERTDIGSNSTVKASELMMLAAVTQGVYQIEEQLSGGTSTDLPGDKTHTFIHFANDLAYTYKRETAVIHGNVAHATHGETVREVLGSGNGSQLFQSFMLKQSPLTFLAAPTAAGAETTLEVRVNNVLWHEAENLFELERNDRGYITRTDNDAKTAVTFGNGRHGARLPTGAENVKALYRFGIGQPGNVAAQQIDQLATRPLGVKGVINPLATSGGADRENRDQARQNVPLAVISLDRLVSLPDYADFARTFAGIAKASATRLSDGQRQLVHLTIAGADDIPIETNSDLYRNLCQALHQLGDPYLPILVELRELIILVISAQVRLLPDYQWNSVEPEIRAALLDTFSFTRRQLGQDALLSEAISAIQHIPGVAYVDIDLLGGIPEAVVEDAALLGEELEKLANLTGQPKQRIPAQLARPEAGQIRPAQLAILIPELSETITLTELT